MDFRDIHFIGAKGEQDYINWKIALGSIREDENGGNNTRRTNQHCLPNSESGPGTPKEVHHEPETRDRTDNRSII
ncbi:uncharacterized protein LOC129774924 isoform X2 [Toxorhynchites rutilus septentrionalis]|uniref:uncharacterized protein LOC129774924 isoform X2 n=1 Tax=Toxorhynchites rutilus septentrionalis TaxID=329112 RepID=UPI002478A50A|nr:uncharacterized protein LOC129774924 isoform X2 [Toxorhynchites rutilus septentrionalis]